MVMKIWLDGKWQTIYDCVGMENEPFVIGLAKSPQGESMLQILGLLHTLGIINFRESIEKIKSLNKI
jgi:hypothetical protein